MKLGNLTFLFLLRSLQQLFGIGELFDSKFHGCGGSVGYEGLQQELECSLGWLRRTWTF